MNARQANRGDETAPGTEDPNALSARQERALQAVISQPTLKEAARRRRGSRHVSDMWTDSILSAFARRRWRGLRTLLRLFKGGSLPPLIGAATRDGLRFDLDPLNYMDALVLDEGYFEREVLDALLPYAGEGAVLWDVGANIGLHAVTLKRLFPQTAVVCFEPSPFAFSRLYANMKVNACELTLACVALSDRAGYAPLSLNVWGSTGISSLRPWERFSYEFSFPCRCERGEDLVKGGVFPAPTVVKLDVENFEHEVLVGLGGLLDGVRAVVFEDHSDDRAASPIDALLAARGFEVVALPPSDPANRPRATNFLARRPFNSFQNLSPGAEGGTSV